MSMKGVKRVKRIFEKSLLRAVFGFVIFVSSFSNLAITAFAASPGLYDFYAKNGVLFYSANTTGCGTSSSSSSGNSGGSGGVWTDPATPVGRNAQILADYFEAKGFSGAGIAGIISNLLAENAMFDPARGEESNISGYVNLANGENVDKMTTYASDGTPIGFGKQNGFYSGSQDYSGTSYGKPGRVPGGGGLIQITSALKYRDIPSPDWANLQMQLDYYWDSYT